jgi:hypothetical protein
MTSRMPSWPDHAACNVEVLVVPGCPGAPLALARVQEVAEELGVHTNMRLLTVDRDEDAAALGFVGSPTVRIDGADVEDVAGRPFARACRLYDGAGRAPSTVAIRRALERALGRG